MLAGRRRDRASLASFLGVYLSFFIDSAPAPTIVLLMTIVFIAAFIWTSLRTHPASASARTKPGTPA